MNKEAGSGIRKQSAVCILGYFEGAKARRRRAFETVRMEGGQDGGRKECGN